MVLVLLELHKLGLSLCSLENNKINVFLKAWMNIKSEFCTSERIKCLIN